MSAIKLDRPQRGHIMLIVLFVIFILMVVGFTALTVETADSRATSQDQASLYALNLARTGVVRATAELRSNYTWGTASALTFPLQGGTYKVSVYAPPSNASVWDKTWKVTSVGTFGATTRTVVAWLHLESFAKFIYYTDNEQMSNGDPIYFITGDTLNGPVHTNDYFSIAGSPQFSQKVASANSNDSFYSQSAKNYKQGGTTYTDPAKFYHYKSSYTSDRLLPLDSSPTFSFSGGQPAIVMPTSNAQIKQAANLTITGDATLTFSSSGQVTVKQSGKSDRSYSTTLLTIYVNNGKATVKGTVDGQVTLGTNRGIDIVDNLVYEDRASDVLGMVAEDDIRVVTSASTKKDIEIDGALMSLTGSFTVDNYDEGVYRGTLHMFGGVSQSARGPVSTFSGSQIVTGYAKDYLYDDRLKNYPPPNFPITGNVTLRSYIDMGALGH